MNLVKLLNLFESQCSFVKWGKYLLHGLLGGLKEILQVKCAHMFREWSPAPSPAPSHVLESETLHKILL